jgi:hypothetical protein
VIVRGVVKDIHSDERIPFASIQFKKSGIGKLTDSVGTFAFSLNEWPKDDTLEVTYVGYQDNLSRAIVLRFREKKIMCSTSPFLWNAESMRLKLL